LAILVFLDTKRKSRIDLRGVMNAVFYILRTGCQWRNLPNNYPQGQAVF
jgi:transposase